MKCNFYILIFFIPLFINASSLNDKFLDAVNNQDIELVKKYIKRRANVNCVASNNWTPLIIAIDKDNPELVKILIEAGAETNIEIPLYNTNLLFYAMFYKKDPEIIKLLLNTNTYKKSINDYYSKYKKTTPLMFAIINYNLEILKLILANGADPNLAGEYGYTPLILAIQNQKAEFVSELLKSGADLGKKDTNRGYTPLVWAISETPQKGTENLEIMKILLDKGANINAKNNDGSTPLIFSSAHGRLELIQFLINNGADVNAGAGDHSPIFKAVFNKDPDVIKLLIDAGADIEKIDLLGETPLFWLIKYNYPPVLEKIKILVKAGANINHKNQRNETPITLAQKKGKKDIVTILKNTKPERKVVVKSADEIRLETLLATFPKINKFWNKAEIQKADTGRNISFLNDDEKNIIFFINLARLNGEKFSETFLDDWRETAKSQNFLSAVDSLNKDLKLIKNLPLLKPLETLCLRALNESKKRDKELSEGKVTLEWNLSGNPVESTGFGYSSNDNNNWYHTPIVIVMSVMINDKYHREDILDKRYNYIGISKRLREYSDGIICGIFLQNKLIEE